jgi:trehalose-phosphatase
LFLDFDGTLTPIRHRPEDVPPIDAQTRVLLSGLANRRRLDIYVISGRRLADLTPRVRVPGLHLLGMYGWEGRGTPTLREERELVQRAKRLLRARLPKTARVWLEDKKLGLAVHYRGARPGEVRATRLLVEGVVEHFKPHFYLLRQKKVLELVPRAVDGKDAAVRRLLGKQGQTTLPIFVGDDAADESAFAALPRGITVRVGTTRRTRARFYLRHPGEVLAFLRKLEAEIT